MSYFGRAYLNQVFDTQSADMWAWCSHSCLNKCRRRNPRRDHLLLLDSSKANIWASRFLICGPGALQPYLIKCSKRNQRRARLVVKAWVQASLWVFTGLIWAWGSQLCLSKCSKWNHRRNEVVSKGSSKSNIRVHRLLISKAGALEPYLSKCSKRNHTISKLVPQALFQ